VNDLKDKYSALHYYLSDVNVVSDSPFTDKLLAYINEYKRCKLRNTITDELESLLEDLNKDESSFTIVLLFTYGRKVNCGDICGSLHWVDGLAWSLHHWCAKNWRKWIRSGSSSCQSELAKHHSSNMFQVLKELMHWTATFMANTYQYPDDLVKELELVADEILPPLASLKKDFCLVSDHGFTVLHAISFKKYISLSSRRFATKALRRA